MTFQSDQNMCPSPSITAWLSFVDRGLVGRLSACSFGSQPLRQIAHDAVEIRMYAMSSKRRQIEPVVAKTPATGDLRVDAAEQSHPFRFPAAHRELPTDAHHVHLARPVDVPVRRTMLSERHGPPHDDSEPEIPAVVRDLLWQNSKDDHHAYFAHS